MGLPPTEREALEMANDRFAGAEKALAASMERCARLEEALRAYGRHLPDCKGREGGWGPKGRPCTCGWGFGDDGPDGEPAPGTVSALLALSSGHRPDTVGEIIGRALGRLAARRKVQSLTTREGIQSVDSPEGGTEITGGCEVELLVRGYGVIFKFEDGELDDLDVVFRRQDT